MAKVHNLCPRRHIGVATIDLIAIGDHRAAAAGSKLFLKTEYSPEYSPHNEPQHCTTNQDEIVLNHPHKNCFVLLKG